MSNANWIPLKLLRSRFTANVTALATRYPEAAARCRDLAAHAATGQALVPERGVNNIAVKEVLAEVGPRGLGVYGGFVSIHAGP